MQWTEKHARQKVGCLAALTAPPSCLLRVNVSVYVQEFIRCAESMLYPRVAG